MHIEPVAPSQSGIDAIPAGASKTTVALLAALLGLALLFVTGFAEVNVLHHAAHDARHSAAFPCH